ncbi:hypothetical protein EPN96_02335 [bacterium]|nr:MAG: hypothetical protein EPN96_02335 [bacterium]
MTTCVVQSPTASTYSTTAGKSPKAPPAEIKENPAVIKAYLGEEG